MLGIGVYGFIFRVLEVSRVIVKFRGRVRVGDCLIFGRFVFTGIIEFGALFAVFRNR